MFILIQLAYSSGGREAVINLIKQSGKAQFYQLGLIGNQLIEALKSLWDLSMGWFNNSLLPLMNSLVTKISSSIQAWR